MITIAFILSQLVWADYLVENQYFAKNCKGAPDTIYTFDISDPFAYDPTLNETWPSFFRFHFADYSVDDTDDCFVPLNGIACTSSLSPSMSFPYSSGSTSWFDTLSDFDSVISKEANGISYCQLTSNNFTDSRVLLGFKTITLRANDNICYDDHFKCTMGGVFSFYALENCSGTAATQIHMSGTVSNVSDLIVGSVSVVFKQFTDATLNYDWWQYTPSIALVPQFDMAFDYITVVVFVMAILIGIPVPFMTIQAIRRDKKNIRPMNYVIIVSQVLVVIWSILKMAFWLVIFPDYEAMAIFAEVREIFFSLGTYASTIATGIICNAGLFNNNKTSLYVIFTSVTVIHIILTGANYFAYYFNGSGLVTPIVQFLTKMNKFQFLWIIFLFAWNCFVPLLISLKFVAAFVVGANNSEKFKTLVSADKYLPYLFAGQIIAIGGYVINSSIRNYTTLLGSDIAFQDATGFHVFFMMLHLSIAARINESMRIVSKFKQSTFTSKKSQGTTIDKSSNITSQ
ncbi:hypothetical protein HDV04_003942 [Boothiomyces sp. JEL0838]|nr:hypothetical protein HDV04_003942 [Boothiomyces sp. JEL0838]